MKIIVQSKDYCGKIEVEVKAEEKYGSGDRNGAVHHPVDWDERH